MIDKSGERVGHLNTVLARGGGNFNDLIFKSSNARVGGDVEVSIRSARHAVLCTCRSVISYRSWEHVLLVSHFETEIYFSKCQTGRFFL